MVYRGWIFPLCQVIMSIKYLNISWMDRREKKHKHSYSSSHSMHLNDFAYPLIFTFPSSAITLTLPFLQENISPPLLHWQENLVQNRHSWLPRDDFVLTFVIPHLLFIKLLLCTSVLTLLNFNAYAWCVRAWVYGSTQCTSSMHNVYYDRDEAKRVFNFMYE